MNATNGGSKRRAHNAQAVAALFFPGTLVGRLAFVGVIAFIVLPISVLLWIVISPLFVLAVLVTVKGWRNKLKVAGKTLAWVIGIYASSTILINVITGLLALLANNGGGFAETYSENYATYLMGLLLITATIWLLMGVPHQAYKIGLDKEGKGSAQSLLIGLLTTTACIFTGIYIWLLHYSLLGNIHSGQLVVGTIFAVVFLAPYYKSLARACWRRGVPGFLKVNEEVEKPWSNTINEMLAARSSSAYAAHPSIERPEITDQDTGTPSCKTLAGDSEHAE